MLLEKEKDLIVQCCVCRKFETTSGEFVDVDESTIDPSYRISHTYCPECLPITIAEIMASK